MSERQAAIERARAAFLRACWLDVAVRKPGNVSFASPGHGMEASMFIASAQAAAGALFEPGLGVGARIERAVKATWAVAGCNTNLGILLLCAPIALAIERQPGATTRPALQAAVESVLAALDVEDARAAYRAIAHARPGGLGSAPAEDVRDVPSIDLRAAMALAAQRDLIARQYRDGFADLFALAFEAPLGALCGVHGPEDPAALPDADTVARVQRLYLAWLSGFADSHIVRNHGEGVAQTVMAAAQAWRKRERAGAVLDADAGFASWDASLKAARINPGTSADLTVAALLLAGFVESSAAPARNEARDEANGWHGS
jgi:triphosphoribosyl-dephospho-CoA synthase